MTIKLYELCGADNKMVFSPHCWKIRMALAHKGLSYETESVGFSKVATIEGGEGRRVPVLRDGDEIIEDSYKIALHLEEKYPDSPSLFNGEGGKAMTHFVTAWSQSQLHPVVARLVLIQIYQSLNDEDKDHFRTTREKTFGMTLEDFGATRGASSTDLHKVLTPIEAMLADQPFIGGQSPLYADYVVFGALQWLRIFKGQSLLKKDSKAEAWMNTLLDMYDGEGRNAVMAA
ncbi:glutathione S-transferase family protein [Ahrensia marina]|uniref:Beta-aryl ether-cleaving protein n=1 Tax=Ahrensia marina TaxID=1514904 RepID=A0A0M9GP10_9HYPH|nr:glutathione S-transferase family protein [Ahrensia marina]KPB02417.1 beta-aryl ether-cleaving protein [Ahrensia marina]